MCLFKQNNIQKIVYKLSSCDYWSNITVCERVVWEKYMKFPKTTRLEYDIVHSNIDILLKLN